MARCIFFFFFLLGATGCFAQATLSRRQAIEDIDVYIRTMKASHYDPFRYIPVNDYNKRIAEIKNTIGDSISTRDFIFLFYQVTALLHDAHSTPQLGQPIFQEEYKKEQFFPYRLVQEKDTLYAPLQLATELGIPAGAEILDINGENLSALFKQVKGRIAGSSSFSEEVSCKLLCYFYSLKIYILLLCWGTGIQTANTKRRWCKQAFLLRKLYRPPCRTS
jgi:hypothetical protein